MKSSDQIKKARLSKLKVLKKEDVVRRCSHDALNFINAGRELVCEACKQRWMAVDYYNMPMYGWAPEPILEVLSRRVDPFSQSAVVQSKK